MFYRTQQELRLSQHTLVMKNANDVCMRFGQTLRRLRKERGFSQIALAEKIDMERTYLSLLENGKKEPCLRMIELLAMGLGISLRQLFWNL